LVVLLVVAVYSCDNTEKNNLENDFEAIFANKSLSDPFAFNYLINTSDGTQVQINELQLKSFISGQMMKEDKIYKISEYQMKQNPNDDTEFAIVALSHDGELTTQIATTIFKTDAGLVVTGKKCKCTSTCSIGCDASFWAGKCHCSRCSGQGKECKKESSIELPDPKEIIAQ